MPLSIAACDACFTWRVSSLAMSTCCAVIFERLRRDKPRRAARGREHRLILRLDEHFEVGLAALALRNLGQHEGIDVAAGRDQIQVGLGARLGGLDVGDILVPLTTQNSLSPQVKSRICSSLGRTMSVV